MSSVVQEWVAENCSWKMQTVLLAAFRGCDGVPKHDISKVFTKNMRASLLKNADRDSGFYGTLGFAVTKENKKLIDGFFIDCSKGSLDQYPVHWMMHLLQAAEIIGYKGPDGLNDYWMYFYKAGVSALHLNPETEEQLDERLKDNLGG